MKSQIFMNPFIVEPYYSSHFFVTGKKKLPGLSVV